MIIKQRDHPKNHHQLCHKIKEEKLFEKQIIKGISLASITCYDGGTARCSDLCC